MFAFAAVFYRNADIGNFLHKELLNLNQAMTEIRSSSPEMWFDKKCGLIQQNIHFLSLMPNAKPFWDPSYQVAIIGNCRLLNQNELRNKLGLSCNRNFNDFELIFQAYLKWGVDLPEYLLGEFSVVIWDAKCARLFAMTDHFNTRPIFYYLDDKRVVISSSIKVLARLRSIPRAPNFDKIARNDWLKFQAIPGETSFADIYFVPAAHRFVINSNKSTLQQYWHPELKSQIKYRKDSEFREAFQTNFGQAIESITNSHLQVGIQLSGGLDSSSIALMFTHRNSDKAKPLFCFSNISVEEKEYLDLIQHPLLVKEEVNYEWRGPFDNNEQFYDTLQISAQHYQHQAIRDAASRHGINCLLHGTLGEITSSYLGYERLIELFYQGRWISLLKELKQHKNITNRKAYKVFLGQVLSSLQQNNLIKRSNLSSHQLLLHNSLIRPDFIAKQITIEKLEKMREDFLKTGQRISNNARYNAYNQLNSFLRHASHIFNQQNDDMEHPIYLSNPYFDKRFVEFCLQVPNEYRFKSGYPRSMIRIGMQDILPQKIQTRLSKTPFLPDYSDRYYRQLPIAKQTIQNLSTNPLVQEIIDVKKLQQMMEISPTSHMRDDFVNFLIIPRTIYLAKFLASF